ncbi:MAG: response regulator [Bacillota bacterium]|nr:response regulator [Bacillota bacterium]
MNREKETEAAPESVEELAGIRVLLAEDNEINMEIVKYILEEKGCIITEDWNGEEAVRIKRGRRSLLLLCRPMRLRRIKGNQKNPE